MRAVDAYENISVLLVLEKEIQLLKELHSMCQSRKIMTCLTLLIDSSLSGPLWGVWGDFISVQLTFNLKLEKKKCSYIGFSVDL